MPEATTKPPKEQEKQSKSGWKLAIEIIGAFNTIVAFIKTVTGSNSSTVQPASAVTFGAPYSSQPYMPPGGYIQPVYPTSGGYSPSTQPYVDSGSVTHSWFGDFVFNLGYTGILFLAVCAAIIIVLSVAGQRASRHIFVPISLVGWVATYFLWSVARAPTLSIFSIDTIGTVGIVIFLPIALGAWIALLVAFASFFTAPVPKQDAQ